MTTIFKRYIYYWKCLINTWCLLYIMPCTPDILLYWVKIQYTFTTNVSKWKKSKCIYMYYPQPFILLFFLFFLPAFEGQVLELPVLQIYIHFRSDECSDTGGGCVLGCLVHHSWLLHPSDSAIQGQVWICKWIVVHM